MENKEFTLVGFIKKLEDKKMDLYSVHHNCIFEISMSERMYEELSSYTRVGDLIGVGGDAIELDSGKYELIAKRTSGLFSKDRTPTPRNKEIER